MARYSTSAAPGAVIEFPSKPCPQRDGPLRVEADRGGGFQATSGSNYLSFNAGGPQGTTYVSACVWPTKPQNDHCDDNN